jgi:hypothetical protein|tara:strand:+ start:56 stop:370 length:315 start_codon:yes stop_codon:yes gene_type:complete
METIMICNVQVEKTDVKLYDIAVNVDMDELKQFVVENHDSFEQFVEDHKDSVDFIYVSEQEYYQSFVNEFIEDKDIELLFMDWCFDHSKYNLELEECSLLSVRQ